MYVHQTNIKQAGFAEPHSSSTISWTIGWDWGWVGVGMGWGWVGVRLGVGLGCGWVGVGPRSRQRFGS